MPNPIIPGAEAFSHAGGPDGVLVLHGFTGSPQSLHLVSEALAIAGLTVEAPLWPGHGTSVEDVLDKTWADWSNAATVAYEALRARTEQVALVGLSMGGALALYLAENNPDIAAVVLVNPLTEGLDPFLLQAAEEMLAAGTEIADGIGSDIALEGSKEISYPELPLRAARSLFEGAGAVGENLSKVDSPVLLFSSRNDHVLQPSNGDNVETKVQGPVERIWLERSFHVATLDYDGPFIASKTVEFVQSAFDKNKS